MFFYAFFKLRPIRIRVTNMKKALLLLAFLPLVAFVSCKKTNTNATQEEVCVFPNITEQGVEPFFVGASLLDIPASGSFYDKIVIHKYYDVSYIECRDTRCPEDEYKRLCNKFGADAIHVDKCFGEAEIIKDGDTIITIDYDDNAQITNVSILSDKFKMGNGIHVGMGASDLLKNFDARFVTQNEWFDGSTYLSSNIVIDIPSLPKHIVVFSECNKIIADFMNKKEEESNNNYDFNFIYKLPSELVSGNTVSKIKICNNVFDCYYKYYKEF